jgi:hypothetical protein
MKTSILHKMSSDDFDRRELDTKNHGIVPNWWKGVTTLALTSVERFEKQYLALQKGWHITCNPEELLEKFNASQSDAHSIECGDFERLNEDWKRFCRNENYYNSPFMKIPYHTEKQRTDDRELLIHDINFIKWYSGIEEQKIRSAFKRYKNEVLSSAPDIKTEQEENLPDYLDYGANN